MIKDFIQAARGEIRADLVLRGGRVVNVFSAEILETDVAVFRGQIVGIGSGYQAEEEVDLHGLYLCPGFIDSHVHIESSMVEVPQFARAVVPLGTTSVVADPHEIANVLGYEGIRFMMDSSKYNPLDVFFMLPSCVPATPLETAGSELRAFDIFPILRERWVLGLAEMMNYPGVLACDPDVLDKLKIVSDKRIDGHAPGLTGRDLNAYVAAGIQSDHECTTVEEAREKLQKGMTVMIREGSGARNLLSLLPLVRTDNERRFLFCTDDRHPNEILREGHINYMVRTAIRSGIPPIAAIRMATLNPAEYFGLHQHGAIAPGRKADLVVFDDPQTVQVRRVYKAGQLVALDGAAVYEVPARPPTSLRSSMNLRWLEGDEFTIPARGRQCRVIGLIPDQIATESLVMECPRENGNLVTDTRRDIVRLYVLERHRASDRIGYGLVHGFGMQKGAMASSISHDSHNVIALGVSDADLRKAVTALQKMGGGIVVVRDGTVLESLELPIAGLMSNRPLEYVSAKSRDLIQAARSLGIGIDDPLMTLSFLALPVIPKLKLTDRGLVDVDRFTYVDLFLE